MVFYIKILFKKIRLAWKPTKTRVGKQILIGVNGNTSENDSHVRMTFSAVCTAVNQHSVATTRSCDVFLCIYLFDTLLKVNS